jgi:hypothetical protein
MNDVPLKEHLEHLERSNEALSGVLRNRMLTFGVTGLLGAHGGERGGRRYRERVSRRRSTI